MTTLEALGTLPRGILGILAGLSLYAIAAGGILLRLYWRSIRELEAPDPAAPIYPDFITPRGGEDVTS